MVLLLFASSFPEIVDTRLVVGLCCLKNLNLLVQKSLIHRLLTETHSQNRTDSLEP